MCGGGRGGGGEGGVGEVGYRKRPRTWDGLTSTGIFIVNAVKYL